MQNIVVPLNSTWLTSQNGTVFIQEQSWTDSKRSERQRTFQTIFHSTWFSNNTPINKQNSKVSEILAFSQAAKTVISAANEELTFSSPKRSLYYRTFKRQEQWAAILASKGTLVGHLMTVHLKF